MRPASQVYYGSDGVATERFCTELRNRGHIGCIAAALFHAQKSSRRAKNYRGGIRCKDGRTFRYRDLAYQRKGSSLELLANLLSQDNCGIQWGWGVDERQPDATHVLYADLPQGQVSFHSTDRFLGPDYPGKWDGIHASEDRVVEFCDWVWSGCVPQPSDHAITPEEVRRAIREIQSDD